VLMHAMKAYIGGMEVELHSFFASRPCRFFSGKEPGYQLSIWVPEPVRTVLQLVASRCTNRDVQVSDKLICNTLFFVSRGVPQYGG
jgi:hypothetical protein